MQNFKFTLFFIILSLLIMNSCGGFKYTPARETPTKGEDRARKNIKEGRGVSLGNAMKRGTTYEFSTSNPMWRASLETLDFLPLTTVDYSGGIIISDWYSDGGNNESIKISLRFLSNEVRTDSLKVIVHKKTCVKQTDCRISLLSDNKIVSELRSTILRKAALLEKDGKNKKK